MEGHDEAPGAHVEAEAVPDASGLPARSKEGVGRILLKELGPQVQEVGARANVEQKDHQKGRDVEQCRHSRCEKGRGEGVWTGYCGPILCWTQHLVWTPFGFMVPS